MGVLSETPSLPQGIPSKDALTQLGPATFCKLCCVITRSVFARAAASVILAGALLVGTTGCVFITPTATLEEYDPSDGVGATLGDIAVRNVVGISNEDGTAISIMVAIVNTGTQGTKVNFQFEADGEKTTESRYVGANTTESFGTTPDGDKIVVLSPSVSAGGLLPVYVQYGDTAGKELLVPVLEAVGDYAELAPATEG